MVLHGLNRTRMTRIRRIYTDRYNLVQHTHNIDLTNIFMLYIRSIINPNDLNYYKICVVLWTL
jgi:hypothetical protein